MEHHYRLPTIRILADNRRGFKIINLSDFDPAKHVPVDEVPTEAPEPRKRGRPPKDRSVTNGA
jgi:hypothetical protein